MSLLLSMSVANAGRRWLILRSLAGLADLDGGDVVSVVRLSVGSSLAALNAAIIPGEREAPPKHEMIFNFPRELEDNLMQMDVSECEVLSLDSGIADCPINDEPTPVLFVTIRVTGQGVVNLAIRNPHRLAEDLPRVIERSAVLNGGEFIPEHPEGDQE